jgi:hypothetical protein
MFTRSIKLAFISCLVALLAACGGSSSDAPSPTGQVAVILTDGPTDQYQRILISLTKFTLIGPGGHVDLYSGPEITFDLLEMSEWGDLAFNTKVLAGQYNKIRLQLSRVELVDMTNNESVVLDALPAGGKIDLNPQGPFDVSPDYTTVVKVDMDAKRSFQVVQTGNAKLKLRPIVFVDVYQGEIFLPERLVRVYGTVADDSFNEPPGSFRLCDLQFISQVGGPSMGGPDDCVRIATDVDTGIFNESQVSMSMSSGFSSIESNQSMTAIGFVTDTDDSSAFLGLEAVAIEIGERARYYATGNGWDTIHGVVASAPALCGADQCFDFDPSDSDPAITTHMLTATRVFRADGVELLQSDVTAGDIGSIDAYRADAMSDFFASLIVLSTDSGSGIVSGILSGTNTADPVYSQLFVTLEGGAPLIVCVDANTAIVQVLADDEIVTLFDLIDPAVLETGSLIEAFGEPMPATSVTCDILAEQVIVEPAP